MKNKILFLLLLVSMAACTKSSNNANTPGTFTGTLSQSDVSDDYGIYCAQPFVDWCRFTNVQVTMSIDPTAKTISAATVNALFTEYSSTAAQSQLIQPNTHTYSMDTYNYSGNDIYVSFTKVSSNPSCKADFTGTVSGSKITGTLTISRNDGISCIAFSVPMSVTINRH